MCSGRRWRGWESGWRASSARSRGYGGRARRRRRQPQPQQQRAGARSTTVPEAAPTTGSPALLALRPRPVLTAPASAAHPPAGARPRARLPSHAQTARRRRRRRRRRRLRPPASGMRQTRRLQYQPRRPRSLPPRTPALRRRHRRARSASRSRSTLSSSACCCCSSRAGGASIPGADLQPKGRPPTTGRTHSHRPLATPQARRLTTCAGCWRA